MSELDYITVKGFKGIASIEKLKLGPMTVLIGPNGSGKSNFIKCILLPECRPGEGRLQEYVIRAGGADTGAALRITSDRESAYSHFVPNERNQYRRLSSVPNGGG